MVVPGITIQLLMVKQENQEMLDVVAPVKVKEGQMVMEEVDKVHVLQMGEPVFLLIIMYLHIVAMVLKEKLLHMLMVEEVVKIIGVVALLVVLEEEEEQQDVKIILILEEEEEDIQEEEWIILIKIVHQEELEELDLKIMAAMLQMSLGIIQAMEK